MPESIKLDQFLKLAQIVHTGGAAKQLIRAGLVQVNGQTETRRGRKLYHGDKVELEGEEEIVVIIEDEDEMKGKEKAEE